MAQDKKQDKKQNPPKPKDAYKDPGFFMALLTQLIGDMINILMENGLLSKGAQAISKTLIGYLGEKRAHATIALAIAALQTGVRQYGGPFLTPGTISLLAETVDEVGDGLKKAYKENGEFLTEDAVNKIKDEKLKAMKEKAKKLPKNEPDTLDKIQRALKWLKGEGAKEFRIFVVDSTNGAHAAEMGTRLQQQYLEDRWHKHKPMGKWTIFGYICLLLAVLVITVLIAVL